MDTTSIASAAMYPIDAAPQPTLCERVERFLPELFIFVGLPPTTISQRAVFALWSSCATSAAGHAAPGSSTRMDLASLFSTWMTQGLNPFHQCLALLTSLHSLGQSLNTYHKRSLLTEPLK